ncbi:MAG TPA: protein kinase [Polyangiales bacterium]
MTSDPESSFEAMLREAAELRAPSPDEVCLPAMGELLQNKYRIEDRLGVGGMGAVYRATNIENGKQVAIKCLLHRSTAAAARFALEARVAARIDHPNVVNVFDVGDHDGRSFLVMELLRGTSLRKRLKAGPLTARALVALMLPLLRGVRAAHAAGVIHRDLKPDNVFLCVASDGTDGEPKVLDFGISKLREALPQSDRLTAEGTCVGTLAYMPPEQLVDSPEVDERTDIYAAGVMMYEALVGRPPFQASGHNALVLAIATHEPAPIRAMVPDFDPALERIVLRAMAKDARTRHATIDALMEELSAWLAGSAQTGSLPPPRARRVARRLGAWSVAIALVASTLGAWLLSRAAVTASPARSPVPAVVAVASPPVERQVPVRSAPASSLPLQAGPTSAAAERLAPPASMSAPRDNARPRSEPLLQAPSRAGALRRSEL